jgi:hypothetical protein
MAFDVSDVPVLESIFLWGIFVLFAFGFGFVSYAHYRQKSGNSIKGVKVSGFANDGSLPWIGIQGQGLRLKTEQKGDAIRVRWALSNYLFVIITMFILGPGLSALFILFPEKISKDVPLPVWFIVGCFMLAGYYVFANQLRKFLFEEPMFDITIDGVFLLKGSAEIERIRVRDIKSLTIEKTTFLSKPSKRSQGRLIDNFTLIILLENGGTKRLCITDYKEQIEQLKSQMETKLRLTADPAMPPSA